jgi:putative inorganic carbon (hco3(-)) transporter
MPLRDLFTVGLFAFAAIHALKRPYYGALLWVWIGLMNPHRLGWGFAYDLPLAMAAAAITVLSMFINYKDVRWLGGAPIKLLIIFIIWMGITTAAAIHVDDSLGRYILILKVAFMTLMLAMVMKTRNEIIGMIWVMVLSLGFFGIKGGIFTILHGGSFRVWGPTDSLIYGNNELAVALIITIPLMYFLAQESGIASKFSILQKVDEKWIKIGLYIAMLLCAVSAIGSQSRGALLAIGAMTVMLWWRSQSKLMLAMVVMLIAPIILFSMPESWFERMNTIQTYEEDESAMGRINAWKTAINVANDRITGAGFTMETGYVYSLYSPSETKLVLVAHSIYFQILGSHGYPGLILYLLFWFATYGTAGRLVKLSKGRPDLIWAGNLGSMCKVSLVGFAVGGAFLNLAYWDMPYYLMVALVASHRLVRERLAELPGNQPLKAQDPARAVERSNRR